MKDGWDAKMWKIAAMVLVLQVVASAAMTQAQGSVLDETGKFSGSYLCVPQAAGGVKWDENRKEWIGSSFKVEADDQLILKINAIERKEWESSLGSIVVKMAAMTYLAEVRRLGKGRGLACAGDPPADPQAPGHGHIIMSPQGEFSCHAIGLTEYKFNLGVLRYIEAYLEGFINGKDTGGDTPYVSVGKCTRID